MASPGFSKQPFGDDDVSPGLPFGATRERDPGFFSSINSGTVLGQLRLMALVLIVAPVLILAITPMIVRNPEDGDGEPGTLPLLLCVPLVLSALVALVAGPRTPKPLPPGLEDGRAAKLAREHFQQAVLARYALAEGTILLGLPLAIIAETEVVFLFGFVVAWPVLVWLALPTQGMVERVRRRLESRGARSHLWAALLAQAPRPRR